MRSGQLLVLVTRELMSIVHLLMEGIHLVRGLIETGLGAAKSLFVTVHQLLVGQDRGFVPIQGLLETDQFEIRQQTAGKPPYGLAVFVPPMLQILEPPSVILLGFQMVDVRGGPLW